MPMNQLPSAFLKAKQLRHPQLHVHVFKPIAHAGIGILESCPVPNITVGTRLQHIETARAPGAKDFASRRFRVAS
jgi:hypothetical protein